MDRLAGSSRLAQELMALHRQEELYASLDVSVLEVKGLQPRKGVLHFFVLASSLDYTELRGMVQKVKGLQPRKGI